METVRTSAEFMASCSGEEFVTISVADAHRLPERQFRARFCAFVEELAVDYTWATAFDWLPFLKGRQPETIPTNEMREIVFANQKVFNPPRRPNDPAD